MRKSTGKDCNKILLCITCKFANFGMLNKFGGIDVMNV